MPYKGYAVSTVGTYMHAVPDTLGTAKVMAKRLTNNVIHPVHIYHNNELVGTYVPKLGPSGRWSFRYKAV